MRMSGSLDDLGALQRAVMEIVWELGEATVAQVRGKLSRRKRLAYTTVLSVMQKLDKSGWLTHREEGRAYVYRAMESRDEAGRSSLKQFVDRVCDGNPLAMFQHLLDDENLSADDLAELRKMIDKRRKELSDD
jgi:BlaI family transcriptional regulator, penicillinase repressor